jgi:hypothetical protein
MNFYRLRGLLVPLNTGLNGGLNTVGRNPTNDVVIHEASVSSFHAEITLDGEGVLVRDLQSTNGTFVDDEPVTESEIRSGQVVRFGSISLRLEIEEPFRISIPKPPPPVAPAPIPRVAAPLEVPPAGGPKCSVNPNLLATHRCPNCERTFHYDHVRMLRLSEQANRTPFCPVCSAQVIPIPGVNAAQARRPGLLARLTQTIQLGFRRPR